jgi:predicted dehydrogenase
MSSSDESSPTSTNKVASVVLIGCGAPSKSMGWYHAVQLLDHRVPYAELIFVVEPFYFSDAARTAPGYDDFHNWRKELEASRNIQFFSKVSDVPPPPTDGSEIRLSIISARTADNPALLDACVEVGCTAIYLEKPGAPTVDQLEAMREKAKQANIKVFMGFNKNVSNYLNRTRDFASSHKGKCDVTFLHNNNYNDTEEELAECFERNSEGMLKNMAIHELAILVTYYGVTVDSIAQVVSDKEFSSFKTLMGPSGKNFSDFDKLKFKVITKAGVEINVAADRCGGDDSVGIVTDAESGEELARFSMPDEEAISNIPLLREKIGDAMPYFFTQDPDYLKLKALVCQNIVHGTPAEGVATIDVAIETLKVAEYLTPILQLQLQ